MKYIALLLTFLTFSTFTFAQEGTPEIIRGHEKFNMLVMLENDNSGKTVDGVEVYLYHTKSDSLVDIKSSIDGVVQFELEPQKEYEIRTCHPSYLKNGFSIFECAEGDEVLCSTGAFAYNYVAAGGKDKPIAFFSASLRMTEIEVGSIFELSNVYYDLDKATLRPNGKAELDDLVGIMSRNQSITIELSSHTDSRASDAYNFNLSQRRAESCYSYLVSKGISASRIVAKGYGESKLVNNCTDDISCSEAQHQKNRRTEIEVLTYEPIECKPQLDIDFKPKDLKNDPENLNQEVE